MKEVVLLVIFLLSFKVNGELKQSDIEQAFKATDTTEKKIEPTLNFTTKCFPDYGCYYNGPPWFDPENRPVSLLPADDPQKKIHYLLFTPHNLMDNYTFALTKESLQNSPFNASAKTAVYIHGWQQHMTQGNMILMKDALITLRGYNVFLIDWTQYVGDSIEEAMANGRVVGKAGALLIEFLSNHTSLTPADFHVIGHSLGGQLVAYVGQNLNGLGRITALDAQGPLYFTDALEVRLDPGDALFVDTIHANGGYDMFDGFGMAQPYGHQDFYPNGGQRQPACGHEDKNTEEEIKHNPLKLYLIYCCDHMRAEDFFVESIERPDVFCKFKGTKCSSYADWKSRSCEPDEHHPVAVMGIDAKPIPGLKPLSKFYLDTRVEYPFCKKYGYKNPTWINANL